MIKKLKNKLALSWIGNNSNNNQVNQNCNVNNFIVGSNPNDVLNVLSENGNYYAIQQYTQQFLETANKKHPLYPDYSASYDSTLKKLISTPETDDALANYPKRAESTLKLDYKKYPNMSKDETPWDYAYRTQTPVELETLAYKEYLGDREDPFPVVEFQNGLITIIKAPEFPPAYPAIISCGDVSLPITIRRVPCLEYGIVLFKDVSESTPFEFIISCDFNQNKTQITFTRKLNCDLEMQKERELLFSNLSSHALRIKKPDGEEILRVQANDQIVNSDFYSNTPNLLALIDSLLGINQEFNIKLNVDLSGLNEYELFIISLLYNSIHNNWLYQIFNFDDSTRSDYDRIHTDLNNQISPDSIINCIVENYYFSFHGVNFLADKYLVNYHHAKINNKKSVLKGIRRKRKGIMITWKPIDGFSAFDKYSKLEGIKVVK